MNLFRWTRGVFGGKAKKTVVTTADISVEPLPVDVPGLSDPDKLSEWLRTRYGDDFNAFLFRRDLHDVLNKEVEPLSEPESNWGYLQGRYWTEKHPFNFPGPFYTGETDTCGTGVPAAPDNVLFDGYCREYVFRQPRDFKEMVGVMTAAAIEVLDSYSCDGNNRWTWQTCREWWRNRDEIMHRLLHDPEYLKSNEGRGRLYVGYLSSTAELDLRKYCYFLENGVYPASEGAALPEVE